ncbi:MAG: hypothetical protein DRI24_11810 [Deltaproteobacteria bacterium]|nr:MAG: hypothetical protein DRI24_11810 [Deltaproteobacteria bacterium]
MYIERSKRYQFVSKQVFSGYVCNQEASQGLYRYPISDKNAKLKGAIHGKKCTGAGCRWY